MNMNTNPFFMIVGQETKEIIVHIMYVEGDGSNFQSLLHFPGSYLEKFVEYAKQAELSYQKLMEEREKGKTE